MRVLIVGCGYVGLAAGTELARQGHEVFGMRRTALAEAEAKAAGIVPVVADITKPLDLEKHDFDWVVNTVSSSKGGVDDYRQVYLEGMRNLLNWLGPKPPKKFVYTSSTSVYGQTDGSVAHETSVTEPASETGRVLLEAERALLAGPQGALACAPAGKPFPAVVLRVAGIYGPGRAYWVNQYLQGEARMTGDGKRIINMIHRDDVAGIIIAALNAGRPGEIYNAVDNEPVSEMDMFRWLSASTGEPMPPFEDETKAEPRKRAITNKKVSNRKLKMELGYRFKYPTFREGFGAQMGSMDG